MMSGAYEQGLPVALERGLVTMAEIDMAVRRVLRMKHAMGLFENPLRGIEKQSPGPDAIPAHLRPRVEVVGHRKRHRMR